MASLIGVGASVGASAFGQKESDKASIEGARTQARIEEISRQAGEDEFQKQMARQQPFIDVGTRALPMFQRAISNRGDASGLPTTAIQQDFVSDFIGSNAPEFIRQGAMKDINAMESEQQKRRLSDLVNIALGGSASQAVAGVNLASMAGQSQQRQGLSLADALQQSAISRQNMANQAVTEISGIPAYIASIPKPLTQIPQSGVFNPADLRR
jgi:hypothetical protein